MSKVLLAFVSGLLICLVAIVCIFIYFSSSHNSDLNTIDDCLKLGSNYRTDLCLEKLKNEQGIEPTRVYTFPIGDLQLHDQGMKGNTYYEPNPTMYVTITNRNSMYVATNIGLKIKFYKSKDATCIDTPDDTEYLTFQDPIGPGDSKVVSGLVRTNFDTSVRFTYCIEATSAIIY